MKTQTLAAFWAAILILLLPACSLPGPVQMTSTSPAPAAQATATQPNLASPEPAPTQESPTSTIPPAPDATLTQPAAEPTSPSAAAGEYAVILVEEDDVLTVRFAAGASSPVVAALEPDARGLTLTGNEAFVDDSRWVEINLPGVGVGWVNALYLTENVDPQTFCADTRVTDQIGRLNAALTTRDGDLLSELVSPAHGMYVHYFHSGASPNYSPEEARWMFESTYVTNWGVHPASGLEVRGTFHEEVLPKLVEVFSSNYELSCNEIVTGGVSYPTVWPDRYENINFYTVLKPGSPEVELDWRTWLVGVEYVDGKPYIFALIQFFWEP